ncbi:holin-associated N-acetylmuramidase [Roseicitreum antarcticum]|uniref:Predicted Peptidoglycan domain-containing protein n=1 Tax=Roseicitreum antarcticum TaxID=564137 RepID=A0A1H2ZVQ1_9RHOB|nr:holin-associated N-acetylmuramidase [Roseicitreum antarcticum]SDX21620.1 Predicted Peptidoglycan domain-containing protein [Roseicitreum antarcticum]
MSSVSARVRQIALDIVAREGGYVNDPDDPGGATHFGVTIHTMRRLGLDLTEDGQVTTADVRALSRAQAVEIFIDSYFKLPRIDALPEPLQASVFDMQVNAGANAVRILQKLCLDMGHDLAVDGVIGPQTIRVVHQAMADAPDHLVDAYGIARRNYYYALADRRPASRKFARRRDGGKGGWITRAEEFIRPAYHLSAAQHQARVASWG